MQITRYNPQPMIAKLLNQIVESKWFQHTIIILILIAAVVVGLETSQGIMAEYGDLLHLIDGIIIFLFVVEALMKMGAKGRKPWLYFYDPWNCFDFIIVVFCLVPATGQFAAVIRLARVLRTLRLVSTIPRLQLIVNSLLKGLPSMGYVGVLLFMLFYVYAVMGVFLFRDNDPFHFGDLSNAMMSLFRVVTLEDWTDIMYTQIYGSDVYPSEGVQPWEPRPQAQPTVAVIYFVSFVVLGTIIMLNLVIGVILSSMQDAERDRDRAALIKAKIDGHGLSLTQEVELIEHQMDELKNHMNILRARLRDAGQ